MTTDTKPVESKTEPDSFVDVAESESATTKWIRRTAVTSIVVFVGLPIITLFVWSFAFRWNFPNMLPSEWGNRAWSYVADDSSRVFEGLWNSTKLGV
ncbi:MAG: hypothetical protein QNL12_07240, partial [Acidimicrobiia bacterium]|nr:hypothetical protein [Acidimicrobiia bacterium]MDX2467089.1 hypothetical protein [Acidimicrobiia bacterium]